MLRQSSVSANEGLVLFRTKNAPGLLSPALTHVPRHFLEASPRGANLLSRSFRLGKALTRIALQLCAQSFVDLKAILARNIGMNLFVWAVLATVLVVPGTVMAQSGGGGGGGGGPRVAVPQVAVPHRVPPQAAVQAPAAEPSLGQQRAGG